MLLELFEGPDRSEDTTLEDLNFHLARATAIHSYPSAADIDDNSRDQGAIHRSEICAGSNTKFLKAQEVFVTYGRINNPRPGAQRTFAKIHMTNVSLT